ncbi:MAG: PDZ domain-containing protein [Betaproteobacteria bacterium]|nr:PDZ domain-containing protein [Betaproteobacteria bacterium]
MLRKFWLIFAQAVTLCLAALFVITTLRPDLLPWNGAPLPSMAPAAPGASTPSVTPAAAAAPAASAAKLASFSDAVKRAVPTVVNIYTSKEIKAQRHPLTDDPVFRYFFGGEAESPAQKTNNLGSGVIVSEQGYILTNAHVVEAADEIEVALTDNRRARAKVIGTDPDTDLAVIKIELPKLTAITFGSSETAQVGDVVLAIGNPFGVGQTVTAGIISALARSQLGINTFENFIQTDAAINPGNSGGALVDVNGNLLGINTAIYSRTPGGASLGIGFAIPATTAKMVLDQLVASGTVTRGWIGVAVQDLTPALSESLNLGNARGTLITEVFNGTPAAQGGVRPGDLLTAVNGNSVTDASSMLTLISAITPGSTATLKVLRAQKELDLKVTVGTRPKMPRKK